jgi:2-amino-4-hydroxy-6-hydroxymethyldihydropteridine diphosphokinase
MTRAANLRRSRLAGASTSAMFPGMRVGLALGSNLGDRAATLSAARRFLLSLHTGPEAPLFSALYETEPLDCPAGSPGFLNAAAEVETPLDPAVLLGQLQAAEREAGRSATGPRNSPRLLDLDLLYYGDLVASSPFLVLPHPRMLQRRFVLQPLAEIRPDLVLPGQTQTVCALLSALPPGPAVRRAVANW